MSKKFNHIALTVRSGRLASGLSQNQLSHKLGYKNGQFISNVERGLCSVPADSIVRLAKAIEIDPGSLIQAAVADYKDYLVSTLKIAA